MNQFIDVFALAQRRECLSGAVPLTALQRVSGDVVSDSGFIEVLWMAGSDEQHRPAANMELRATLTMRCDRCDQPMSWKLAQHCNFFFVNSDRELAALAVDVADNEPLLGSDRFDLFALVEDELILALPLSPRHEQPCQSRHAHPDADAALSAEVEAKAGNQNEGGRHTSPVESPAGPSTTSAQSVAPSPTHRPFERLSQLRRPKTS